MTLRALCVPRIRGRLRPIIVVFCFGLFLLGGAAWFFSVNWQWPFRLSGAYDDFAAGRVFPGSNFSIAQDGSALVFASPRTGKGDIYTCALDGTAMKRLTSNPNFEGNPCFSADGESIAFEREVHNCAHIWIMNRDGSNQKQLTMGTAYDTNPRFAPDGKHLWFLRRFPGSRVVSEYSMDVQGMNQCELVCQGRHFGDSATYPTVGHPIYYQYGSGEIWTISGDLKEVHPFIRGFAPSVSADGRRIAYLTSSSELCIVNADGTNAQTLYRSNDSALEHPAFCLDDTQLLFVEQDSPSRGGHRKFQIAHINMNGTGYRVVIRVL